MLVVYLKNLDKVITYGNFIEMVTKEGLEPSHSRVILPHQFSSRRPLMAQVSGVASCKRGEQVSLRVTVHNTLDEEMLAEIVLRGSPSYKFVHVEENGIVSSYGARLSSGDHQILVYVSSIN